MIDKVIAAAVREALTNLPPQALGVRSHAIPTEEHLEACVRAALEVVNEPLFADVVFVIGSSRHGSVVGGPNVRILPPDAAAAEATRLRNDPKGPAGSGHPFVYMNSDSSPGEAGLDALSELRAPAIAQHFARFIELPILSRIAGSVLRSIKNRLDDSSVDQLATYAEMARAKASESSALPLLGLIPRDHSPPSHPTAAWPADFDGLIGEKLVNRVRETLQALEKFSADERDRLIASLEPGIFPPGLPHNNDKFAFIQRVARGTLDFASGNMDRVAELCGLSARLLRIFRLGSGIASLAVPPSPLPPGPEERPTSTRRPLFEDEFLEQQEWTGEVEVVQLDEDARSLRVATEEGEFELRSREGAEFIRTLSKDDQCAQLWLEGGSVRVALAEALLSSGEVRGVAPDFHTLLPALDQIAPSLRPVVSSFVDARAAFLSAVATQSGHSSGDEEEEGVGPEDGITKYAVLLLESFPLMSVRGATEAAQQYLQSYEALALALLGGKAAQELSVWLTNLDVAFYVDRGQVTAARLLPTHPLRVAHALAWLTSRKRPPSFPGSLVVHYRSDDWLTPHGREFSFRNISTGVGPDTDSLRVAAHEGINALWTLIAPLRLQRALDVELVDVSSPLEVIEALCEAVEERYEDDATISGVHIRVGFAFSDTSRQNEVVVARRASLLSTSSSFAEKRPGAGVSLELLPEPRKSGSAEVHLALQAVETPYVRLPHEMAPEGIPGTEVSYVPGDGGNIKYVSVRGNATIEAYHRLLDHLNITHGRGFAPINKPADVGRSIVRTLASKGGWPTSLPFDESFLAYSEHNNHLIVSLCDREVAARLLEAKLGALSKQIEGETDLDPGRMREGIQAMYSCRDFIAKLLADIDARHLLGELGVLRAFNAARGLTPGSEQLVVSLDGPEGRAWASTIAELTDSSETRADLLILEAPSALDTIAKIRVAELKARTSTSQLNEEINLAKLARQSQITAARVRSAFTEVGDSKIRIEALRRLVWLSAGHQLAAWRWQTALRHLDRALTTQAPISVHAECWIVPEDTWTGDTDFTLQLQALDETGANVPGKTEPVRFKVLGRQAVKAHAPPRPPEPAPVVPITARAVQEGARPKTGKEPPAPPSVNLASRAAESPSSTRGLVPPTRGGSTPPATPAAAAASPPSFSGPSPSYKISPPPPAPAPIASSSQALSAPPGVSPQSSSTAAPSSQLEISLGSVQSTGVEALWRPYERAPRLSNQHLLVVGKSGSGKSETTKALIWELDRRGVPSIIFDFQGEYAKPDGDFFRAVRPQVFDAMAGLPINPFEVPIDPHTGKRRPFIESVYRLADTLNRVFKGSGDIQLGALRDAILQSYHQRGFDKDDEATWSNEPPTIDMLHACLKEMAQERGATVKNLLVRLQSLFESGIFKPGRAKFTLESLLKKTTVLLMTSGISDLMLAASRLMLEGIYASMLSAGESSTIRVMACVDEAHKLCGDETITTLVKEARKYGLGLILSSQETRDFHPSVFANVGTLICLQLEEADAAVMARQIAGQDGVAQKVVKQKILAQAFPEGIVRSNHFQPYVALRLNPFHERLKQTPPVVAPEEVAAPASTPQAQPVTPSNSAPAEHFLEYELIRPLRGGMAEVYEARHSTSGERVCVKRVRRASGEEDALQREAQIYQKIQSLESNHLLQLRALDRTPNYLALVMDFADGGDLAEYVEKEPGGRLKPSKVKEIALQIADGLRVLHGAGIVHRDLKPQNVLLSGQYWQLADYGIAKNLTRLITMRTFQAAGTLGYMAPEQMDGSEAAPSADVYSLGKIIVFMLTGATDKDYVTQLGWRSLTAACLDPSPDVRPTVEKVIEGLQKLRV